MERGDQVTGWAAGLQVAGKGQTGTAAPSLGGSGEGRGPDHRSFIYALPYILDSAGWDGQLGDGSLCPEPQPAGLACPSPRAIPLGAPMEEAGGSETCAYAGGQPLLPPLPQSGELGVCKPAPAPVISDTLVVHPRPFQPSPSVLP